MTINFNDITRASGHRLWDYDDVPLSKIYGQNDVLLWELKNLPNITQATDYFLFTVNHRYVEVDPYYGNDEKYYTFERVIVPQIPYSSSAYNGLVEGIGWYSNYDPQTPGHAGYTPTQTQIRQMYATINGLHGIIDRPAWYPFKNLSENRGVWQLVKFYGDNGIYLYSPVWKKIVSKNSGCEPDNWIYTDVLSEGYDLTNALTIDPFNPTWTNNTLRFGWLDENYHGHNITQGWSNVMFNQTHKSTVYIFTDEWPNNIRTFFEYDDPNATRTVGMYMIKPTSDDTLYNKAERFDANIGDTNKDIVFRVSWGNNPTTQDIAILPDVTKWISTIPEAGVLYN